ncbi:hypothetical protein J6590_016677 [Homalodisca vitripennis]|nr:hypothetical protein J6590_016677 [Homalodisca vitripennis]
MFIIAALLPILSPSFAPLALCSLDVNGGPLRSVVTAPLPPLPPPSPAVGQEGGGSRGGPAVPTQLSVSAVSHIRSDQAAAPQGSPWILAVFTRLTGQFVYSRPDGVLDL